MRKIVTIETEPNQISNMIIASVVVYMVSW